jgi:dTDP-4-dehydrorhamnose reductase
VFDGTLHGYREDDQPTPVSVYGETKAAAEAVVAAAAPSAIILRLALVLGFAGRTGTNSLLDNLGEKWKMGRPVELPVSEYRNPIDAPTLGRFIMELRERGAHGLYHLGSRDSISRFALGLKLAERMGYPSDLVQPQTEPPPGRAPRGLDQFLLTDKIATGSGIPVPSCDEVIERCFDATS